MSIVKVTLYGAPWCAFCQTEKQWLESKSVSFDYVDVDENKDALDYLHDTWGSSGIPVTIVEDEDDKKHAILGFNRPELSRHIGI